MRPVLPSDLRAAAGVLLAAPEAEWPALAAQLVWQSDTADRYRKRLGKAHPRFGTGSLLAASLARGAPPGPAFMTDRVKCALVVVLQALLSRAGQRDFTRGGSRLSAVKCDRICPGDRPMTQLKHNISTVDPVWERICEEAQTAIRAEPLMGGLIHSGILHHASFERALAYRISLKLASGEMSEQILREIADAAFAADPDLGAAARADLAAVFDRDPACHRLMQPLLYFKGYQAIQSYRLGHWLWQQGRKDLAYFIQMRVSEMFGVDIHPAARIGRGIMVDHAHSIVIGETAVVGDNVSMLHSVTLGGTGKEDDDRHPKIGNGVMIGAGAKVLGNIRVGNCSRIAAGSVVLEEVPPCTTVAGVPARIVGSAGCDQPSISMDQILHEDFPQAGDS